MNHFAPLLYHCRAPLFSERVRPMLGFQQLAWRSERVSSALPRTRVLALAGGYRRTPLLQMGAGVDCDTQLVATVLEHLQSRTPLYPPLRGVARPVAGWANHTLCRAAMAYNLQPRGAAVLFANAAKGAAQAFAAGSAMRAGMQRLRLSEATAACHPLRFARTCAPPLASIFGATPAVLGWMGRMAALGHGRVDKLKAQDAIAVAAGAEPLPLGPCTFQDEQGVALDSPAAVSAQSFGQGAIRGKLLAGTRTRCTLRRHGPRTGAVPVHFPRIGYVLRKAGNP